MNKFVPPTLRYIEAVNSIKKTTVSKIKQKENKNPTYPKAKSSKKCSSLSEVIEGAQKFVPSAKPKERKTSIQDQDLCVETCSRIFNGHGQSSVHFKESNKTTQVYHRHLELREDRHRHHL